MDIKDDQNIGIVVYVHSPQLSRSQDIRHERRDDRLDDKFGERHLRIGKRGRNYCKAVGIIFSERGWMAVVFCRVPRTLSAHMVSSRC
jgi:hypothetical protein